MYGMTLIFYTHDHLHGKSAWQGKIKYSCMLVPTSASKLQNINYHVLYINAHISYKKGNLQL